MQLDQKKTISVNQHGMSLVVLVAIVAVSAFVVIAITTPQLRKLILPQKTNPQVTASPSATINYSDKQLLYLRNKAVIQKELNLNDEQFQLLLESANKN